MEDSIDAIIIALLVFFAGVAWHREATKIRENKEDARRSHERHERQQRLRDYQPGADDLDDSPEYHAARGGENEEPPVPGRTWQDVDPKDYL